MLEETQTNFRVGKYQYRRDKQIGFNLRQQLYLEIYIIQRIRAKTLYRNSKSKAEQSKQELDILVINGQRVMSLKATDLESVQCSVGFALTILDYGYNKKFKMVICSSIIQLDHNNSSVAVISGKPGNEIVLLINHTENLK